MQTILQIHEIAKRLRKIGLQPKDLSRRAGISFATFYRGLTNPEAMRIGTLEALTRELFAAEIEARDALLALHPITDKAPEHQVSLEAAE
jgi:hypothetical protein